MESHPPGPASPPLVLFLGLPLPEGISYTLGLSHTERYSEKYADVDGVTEQRELIADLELAYRNVFREFKEADGNIRNFRHSASFDP
ncbi:unnamed protein product [Penicillium pancosmium]